MCHVIDGYAVTVFRFKGIGRIAVCPDAKSRSPAKCLMARGDLKIHGMNGLSSAPAFAICAFSNASISGGSSFFRRSALASIPWQALALK